MTLKLNGTTSGSVSLDAPATGSNVSFTLPGSVGSSGQLLSTDGSGVLSFVNGGKILQIVRATDTTQRMTTSTSFSDVTGMTVTITPQKSNSAVLIIAAFLHEQSSGATQTTARFQITDSSNNGISGAQNVDVGLDSLNSTAYRPLVLMAYATPSTTSAVTYKLRFRTNNVLSACSLLNQIQTGQMYAIEVAA